MTWCELDYRKTVRNIAEGAIQEFPFGRGISTRQQELQRFVNDERQQYVSESVDGNEYVIYYGANEIALRASDNEPDGSEVRALYGSIDADWRTMRTMATYMAMEADVLEEIDRLYKKE